MLVVSNTSPISNLAIIGRLEFLKQRYGLVRIPVAVADELAALSHPAGAQRIKAALSERWLLVEQLGKTLTPQLPFLLDPGETAAIALALQFKADVRTEGGRSARGTDPRQVRGLDPQRAR